MVPLGHITDSGLHLSHSVQSWVSIEPCLGPTLVLPSDIEQYFPCLANPVREANCLAVSHYAHCSLNPW